ncbi:MAG: hemerythrin [Pusillimonas sp.]|jgi:hemerythrin-like domain-containing protein|nr:hemerythrin [Pusillimonas sp.]|tara:strand:+ start:135 stop:680 length:546 start_codon:yes stop_codon:yes gene_type:complete
MSDHPIQQLVDDHRYILMVVNHLNSLAPGIAGSEPVDVPLLRQAVEFMREFADHCHHGKEEDLLFPALVEANVPESGCPIGGLKGEHVKGRKLVGQLEEGINLLETDEAQARQTLCEAIRGIALLYPDHIWKEDAMVFPMAERLLSDAEVNGLKVGFAEVEKTHAHHHQKHTEFALSLQAA